MYLKSRVPCQCSGIDTIRMGLVTTYFTYNAGPGSGSDGHIRHSSPEAHRGCPFLLRASSRDFRMTCSSQPKPEDPASWWARSLVERQPESGGGGSCRPGPGRSSATFRRSVPRRSRRSANNPCKIVPPCPGPGRLGPKSGRPSGRDQVGYVLQNSGQDSGS